MSVQTVVKSDLVVFRYQDRDCKTIFHSLDTIILQYLLFVMVLVSNSYYFLITTKLHY